jgi:hypothetical protein
MPVLLGAVLSRPAVQMKIYAVVQQAARLHTGHINTPGFVYKTLDSRFYINNADIDDMGFLEASRFLVRSAVRYVMTPAPWEVQSPAALLYVPEQVIWYVLVALLPFGVVYGFRRDALVTALLIAHAMASAFIIAITSGNVGTLVRHRGMAIPYIVWLSAVGGCAVVTRLAGAAAATDSSPAAVFEPRMEPRCP